MPSIVDRATDRLHRLLQASGRVPAADAPSALTLIVNDLLEPLIAERARELSERESPGTEPSAGTQAKIAQAYAGAFEATLGHLVAELVGQGRWHADGLDALARPAHLRVAAQSLPWNDPPAFARALRRLRPLRAPWRQEIGRAPLAALPDPVVARTWMLAAQRTALAMLLRNHRGVVPAPALEAVQQLLTHTHGIGQRWAFDPPLPSLEQWQHGLSLALARKAGRVQLPLKPIPTAPLAYGSPAQPYTGRADEDAQRLARQLRHSDGVVLVTGYRGVGKSSFVNRAIGHATHRQGERSDGWLLVPVVVNVAKTSGVASVLRLTLRAVKQALIDDQHSRPNAVSGVEGATLPLNDGERSLLDLAYIRATWKVALNRSQVDHGEWNAGIDLTIDPGKLLGGGIGPLARLGAKRSRQEKLSRELSLLDYDEDAADGDLCRLIDSLASPRSWAGGDGKRRPVRIKLVVVFDELDKLDHESGVKPLLNGLKNLFLRQHAVFVLVTSKKLYYELREQRAVEDATLSSLFSEVVHVSLLDAAQVRTLLESWIDRGQLPLPEAGPVPDPAAETWVLDRLARYLTYQSLGNPREVIRALRQMQEWGSTDRQPFISDRIARLPEVAVYAALQQAVETAVVPWQGGGGERVSAPAAGEATLAFERVGSDIARLEQLKRGMYILVEAAIDRGQLTLDEATLEPLRKDNLNLFSLAEVKRLALQLGRHLEALSSAGLGLEPSPSAGVAAATAPSPGVALFVLETPPARPMFKAQSATTATAPTLQPTRAFYALSGRRSQGREAPETAPEAPADERLAAQALADFAHGGRAERLLGITMCARLPASALGAELIEQLREVVRLDPDPEYRRKAIEALPVDALLEPSFPLATILAGERDDATLAAVVSRLTLLAASIDRPQRAAATELLLRLVGSTGHAAERSRRPGAAVVLQALYLLEEVADADHCDRMLDWLVGSPELGEPVNDATLKLLVGHSRQHGRDLMSLLFDHARIGRLGHLSRSIAKQIEAIVGERRAQALKMLLAAEVATDAWLRPLVRAAAAADDEAFAAALLDALAQPVATLPGAAPGGLGLRLQTVFQPPTKADQLPRALAGPDFDNGLRPWLQKHLDAQDINAPEAGARRAMVKRALDRAAAFKVWSFDLFAAGQTPWDIARNPADIARWESTLGRSTTAARNTRWDPEPADIGLLLLAALLFTSTLFVPGDLPTDASWPQRLLARALSLGLPASLAWFLHDVGRGMESLRTRSAERSGSPTEAYRNAVAPVLFLVPWGIVQAHQEWLVPMSFWPTQAMLFVINGVAVGLAWWALQRMQR